MSESFSWPTVLGSLVRHLDLERDATRWAMNEILSDAATPAQIAAFVVALRSKGETVEEIEGLVEAMYAKATPLDIDHRVVDIVGTGGDQAHTVNISSMAAVVIAGTGIPVVKHGNRAASSKSGSADVLEALGVGLDVPVAKLPWVLDQAGIAFCFAPVFHSSLRFAAKPRSELGIPTTFNFLGPLTNPAKPAAMALGVADARMAPLMADVLARRGTQALVFRGDDGLDELTMSTSSTMWVANEAGISSTQIDPQDFGFALAPLDALRGGDATHNAEVFRAVMAGEDSAIRDAVVLNAGAALAAFAGYQGDLHQALADGITRAKESIDSGAATGVLNRWIEASGVATNQD